MLYRYQLQKRHEVFDVSKFGCECCVKIIQLKIVTEYFKFFSLSLNHLVIVRVIVS